MNQVHEHGISEVIAAMREAISVSHGILSLRMTVHIPASKPTVPQ